MTPQAIIIADLGFGDAGKGTTTDYLVRQLGASLVVRFNGGAQAGHTVVLEDGRTHTFSQLGAGSFVEGVRTHLSKHTLVHPGGLLEEAEVLKKKGVGAVLARLSVSEQALIVTPFHQSANRLREALRGAHHHGSCGLGIGETAEDALEHPEDQIRAADLFSTQRLRSLLLRLQQRKWALFAEHRQELRKDPQGSLEMAVLESADISDRWISMVQRLAAQVEIAPLRLERERSVVFEGAQGVLLDEWRGFHPHTTWSTCTFANALELLKDWHGPICKLGVFRSYATRHGAGPFPTEDISLDLPEPHNSTGRWQGGFRVGWFDAVLARYAVQCCGGVDGLVLTHVDRVRDDWQIATAYDGVAEPYYQNGQLVLGPERDLAYQERLGAALRMCVPRYQPATTTQFRGQVEELLDSPAVLESWGPTWQDKRLLAPLESQQGGRSRCENRTAH